MNAQENCLMLFARKRTRSLRFTLAVKSYEEKYINILILFYDINIK